MHDPQFMITRQQGGTVVLPQAYYIMCVKREKEKGFKVKEKGL